MPRCVAHERRGQQRPHPVPTLRPVTLLALERGDFAGQDPETAGEALLEIVRMSDLRGGAAHDLRVGVAEEVAEEAVDTLKAPLEIHDRHSDRGVIECRAKVRVEGKEGLIVRTPGRLRATGLPFCRCRPGASL